MNKSVYSIGYICRDCIVRRFSIKTSSARNLFTLCPSKCNVNNDSLTQERAMAIEEPQCLFVHLLLLVLLLDCVVNARHWGLESYLFLHSTQFLQKLGKGNVEFLTLQ